MERTCSRFNDLKLRRNHVYVIAIVKFSKRSIQNLFHVDNSKWQQIKTNLLGW